jgi:hypothetical protein
MPDPLDDFRRSLDASQAPTFATPALNALWLGLREQWDAAHELAQSRDDADCAWVHAWLHRIEGDASNAAWWYDRAGREPGRGDTRQEGLAIAKALLDASSGPAPR